VVNADGPVDDDILSRGPSASPPNSIAGLGPNQVGEIDRVKVASVAEPKPRAEEPKLNCLLEPEPEPNYELRLRLLSIYQRLEEILHKKNHGC
jgi:hypothetical protein